MMQPSRRYEYDEVIELQIRIIEVDYFKVLEDLKILEKVIGKFGEKK